LVPRVSEHREALGAAGVQLPKPAQSGWVSGLCGTEGRDLDLRGDWFFACGRSDGCGKAVVGDLSYQEDGVSGGGRRRPGLMPAGEDDAAGRGGGGVQLGIEGVRIAVRELFVEDRDVWGEAAGQNEAFAGRAGVSDDADALVLEDPAQRVP
jgi:hypothetical protein